MIKHDNMEVVAMHHDGEQLTLETIKDNLVRDRNAMQKSCLFDLSTDEIAVRDQSAKGRKIRITDYLLEFLEAKPTLSEADSTKLMYKAAL